MDIIFRNILYFFLLFKIKDNHVTTGSILKPTDKQITAYEAKQMCASLPVDNDDKILHSMTTNGFDAIWMGISRNVSTWFWINKMSPDSKMQPANQPECGFVDVNGQVNGMSCVEDLPFMCEFRGLSCFDTYSTARCMYWNNSTLLVGPHGHNWYSARAFCQSFGGDLAALDSNMKLTKALSLARKVFPDDSFWVGRANHQWKRLTDSISVNFHGSKWLEGQPSTSGNCVILSRRGSEAFWKMTSCSNHHNVLCAAIPRQYITVYTRVWQNKSKEDVRPLRQTEGTFLEAAQACGPEGIYFPTDEEATNQLIKYMNKINTKMAWLPLRRETFPYWEWKNGRNYGRKCSETYNMYHCLQTETYTYLTFINLKSWYIAHEICHLYGGTLVSFENRTQMKTLLQSYITKTELAYVNSFFTSLQSAKWSQHDGTIWHHHHLWAQGEPKEEWACSAVELVETVIVWNAVNCTRKLPAICNSPSLRLQLGTETLLSVDKSSKNVRTISYLQDTTQGFVLEESHFTGMNKNNATTMMAIIICISLVFLILICAAVVIACCKCKRRRSSIRKKPIDQTKGEENMELIGANKKVYTEKLDAWRNLLAVYYQRILKKVPLHVPKCDAKRVRLDQIFTKTTLQDVNTLLEPKSEPYHEYDRMFSREAFHRKVLLVGEAGSGKSTCTHRIALNWTQKIQVIKEPTSKDWLPSTTENKLLENIDILILIDLSQIRSRTSLVDIFHQHFHLKEEDCTSLLHFMKDSERSVFIMLDSWDEFESELCPELDKIAKGEMFPNMFTLVTSRHSYQDILFQKIDNIVKSLGFSRRQTVSFIDTINLPPDDQNEQNGMLSKSESDIHDNKANIIKFLTDTNLWELFSLPFLTLYLCLLSGDLNFYHQKFTFTNLLILIVTYIVNRHVAFNPGQIETEEAQHKDQSRLLLDFKKEILSLGEIGLNGILKSKAQTVFAKEELGSVSQTAIDLGLMQLVEPDITLKPQVKFGHKILQEFLAAIFVTNSKDGETKFFASLTTLGDIYNLRQVIMFICGLDKKKGGELIKVIKKIAASNTAKVEECPEFSRLFWFYNKGEAQYTIQLRKAEEITPYLLACCWEIVSNYNNVDFPSLNSKAGATKAEKIILRPHINFNTISLAKMVHLLKERDTLEIDLKPSKSVVLYNINILYSHAAKGKYHQDINNLKFLLDFIEFQEISFLDIGNATCDYNFLSEVLNRSKKLQVFEMEQVHLPKEEMPRILDSISKLPLKILFMEKVEIAPSIRNKFCESVSLLSKSIRQCSLRSLLLGEHASILCNIMTNLWLVLLDLENTDMFSARNALPEALCSLPELRWLCLYKCNLGGSQIKHIFQSVAWYCKKILLINLSGNRYSGKMENLQHHLAQMQTLKVLRVPKFSFGKFQSSSIKLFFMSMPISVAYLEYEDCEIKDDFKFISEFIFQRKNNLRYLYLNSQNLVLQNSCIDAGITLLTCKADYIKHAKEIGSLEMDAKSEIDQITRTK